MYYLPGYILRVYTIVSNLLHPVGDDEVITIVFESPSINVAVEFGTGCDTGWGLSGCNVGTVTRAERKKGFVLVLGLDAEEM